MLGRGVGAVVVVLLFAAGAVLYTWPLATDPGARLVFAVPEPGRLLRADVDLTSWILAWGAHALRTDPLGLFDANAFHPLPLSLAFSENLVAGALLVLPIDLWAGNPVLDHNVLLLASFVVGGLGTTLLVRELGGGWAAGVIAGALFVFGPTRVANIHHVQTLSTHWMPVALLCLHRAVRTGAWRWAVTAAVAVWLQAASSVYWAYYFGLALVVLGGAYALVRGPAAPRAYRRLAVALALAVLAFVPLLLPYAEAREIYALGRTTTQTSLFSTTGAAWIDGVRRPIATTAARLAAGGATDVLLGVGVAVLALLGIGRGAAAAAGGRRVALAYGALAVSMALLSLGPTMRMQPVFSVGVAGPHRLLAAVVPGFAALRVPARASVIALLALAVLAGLGAAWVLRRRRPGARLLAGAALAALTLLECWRPALWAVETPPPPRTTALYRWLAAADPEAPLVELPLGVPTRDAAAMVASSAHWRPLVNGHSGFAPTRSYLQSVLFWFPNPPSLRLLQSLGVRHVVMRPERLPPPLRAVCDRVPVEAEPFVERVYADATACVFALHGAPAPAALPADVRVARSEFGLVLSTGEDVSALVDGDLGTHWTQAVTKGSEAWLQIDLRRRRRVTRLVLRLGPHFGEYLRAYRIDQSGDGRTWEPLLGARLGEPPLAAVRADPGNLAMEIALRGTPVRHLRVVRVGALARTPWDLWAGWQRWGLHELEVHALP